MEELTLEEELHIRSLLYDLRYPMSNIEKAMMFILLLVALSPSKSVKRGIFYILRKRGKIKTHHYIFHRGINRLEEYGLIIKLPWGGAKKRRYRIFLNPKVRKYVSEWVNQVKSEYPDYVTYVENLLKAKEVKYYL